MNQNKTEYKVKIEYYENGQKLLEKNGKLHREDGSVIQVWYDNGNKWSESWYLNGLYHRLDGPASQSWNNNGDKLSESWYLNGKLHREDGPAFKSWYSNGNKWSEYWYLNGVELSEQEFKLRTDPEYQKYLELKVRYEGAKK